MPSSPATASLSEVARRSKVSPATASRVLNNFTRGFSVREEIRERILRTARELNYRPNGAARAVAQQRHAHVGVLTANASVDNSQYTNLAAYEMILGLTEVLAEQGYLLSMIHIEAARGHFADQSRVFTERWLDGIVVVGPTPAEIIERLPTLIDRVVWLDSDHWQAHGCLRRSEQASAMRLAAHVVDQGYQRLLWVGSTSHSDSHYSARERWAGVREMAEQRGVATEQLDFMPWEDHHSNAEALRNSLGPDTAVLASDSLVARWVANAAAEKSLTAPRDFGLASCDDNREVRVSWPQLTCVSVNRYRLGAAAGRMMLDMVERQGQVARSRKFAGRVAEADTTRRQGPTHASDKRRQAPPSDAGKEA